MRLQRLVADDGRAAEQAAPLDRAEQLNKMIRGHMRALTPLVALVDDAKGTVEGTASG
jgi:hypothetical protein